MDNEELDPEVAADLAMNRRLQYEREDLRDPTDLGLAMPFRPANATRFVPEKTPDHCSSCNTRMAPNYGRCPKCEGHTNRECVERLRTAIQKLKVNPPRGDEAQRVAMKELSALGHPDAKGCVDAICSAGSGKRRGAL